MRRRLVRNTILVTVMVLVVLATPVILLLKQSAEDELTSRLSGEATAIRTAIETTIDSGGDVTQIDVSRFVLDGDQVRVTLPTGEVAISYGAVPGVDFFSVESGPRNLRIEIGTSGHDLRQRLTRQFLLLGVLAAGGVLLAAVLAAIFGARVSRPLEQLAASAGRLGAGDFSAALPPPSGIREIDDIRATLSMSASRLDQTLLAERSFTADATHQLRTGLTGIALQLQLLASHSDPEVQADAAHALANTDRLTATLDELLELARGGRGSQRASVLISEIALQHRGDWLPRYQLRKRGLICQGRSDRVLATPGFVGQIIDILLDNALTHGRGDVRIVLAGRQLQIADDGAIDEQTASALFHGSDDPAAPHGRGLSLARRLAQADGGNLELAARAPTTFVLRLPAAHV